MASIASRTFDRRLVDPWVELVRIANIWVDEQAIALRDAVVLVPFAQHLPLARSAWARLGTWMPRIETTQSLARALGAPEPLCPAPIRFESALDRLTARRLLLGQEWASRWSKRDLRGFEQSLGAMVAVAQGLARAAATIAPSKRSDHWAHARGLLVAASGPGALERTLGRIALEWAAAAGTPNTDRLFALQPSAWIAVQSGGVDALAQRVLEQASVTVPCLLVDSDADASAPLAEWPARIEVAYADDFEDEAQRTAAHLLEALQQGAQPVALIAQDRLLVRRVRALLTRHSVPVQDETGWKLSTTRAGAVVATLLRAARGDASCDERLDWLKGCNGDWPSLGRIGVALEALEGALRRRGWTYPAAVDPALLGPASARLWEAADGVLESLRRARPQRHAAWVALLAGALEASGAMPALREDDAGRQVLDALHVDEALAAPFAFGDDEPLDLAVFTAWVDAALEEGMFRPEAPADAMVVITPLERASLRPFAAVVLAGADEKRLGAMPAPTPLLGDALGAQLGLPTAETRRERETRAFAQLLRVSRVILSSRKDDGGEPLAPSPLLERLELARLKEQGAGLQRAADPRVMVVTMATPVTRPLPRLVGRVPERLSASACEALRTCPYRFHALYGLRLREVDELDDEVEKRDYGTWLHAVLHRFHSDRANAGDAEHDKDSLQAIGRDLREEMHLDDAAFLPFVASFDGFVARYVDWLHEREAAGMHWIDGERELTTQPDAWSGVAMQGRIDRMDADASGRALQLIDYKTGSADDLIRKARDRLEDTQLAFYAALVAGQPASRHDQAATLSAGYLTLDERDRIRLIEHLEVESSGQRLVQGIGDELARIRAGEPLPALGEGRACQYCEARGLCRRDHWPAESPA